MFGYSLNVDFHGDLFINKHGEAFVTMEGDAVYVVKHESCATDAFGCGEIIALPYGIVRNVLSCSQISGHQRNVRRGHLFFAPLHTFIKVGGGAGYFIVLGDQVLYSCCLFWCPIQF